MLRLRRFGLVTHELYFLTHLSDFLALHFFGSGYCGRVVSDNIAQGVIIDQGVSEN